MMSKAWRLLWPACPGCAACGGSRSILRAQRCQQGTALPAGGWLTNLRRLALPIRQLHNSAAALASARQLQTLAVDAVDDSDLLPEVLRWAVRRPTLELVLLQLSRDPELRRHLDAILEVQRSAPQLRIQHCPDITQHPHFCATD